MKLKNKTCIVIDSNTKTKFINIGELKEYRDLFIFLIWRDIKVKYAQTILGFVWAIINPLVQIIIFSIIFGKIAKLPTEGIPYLLYVSVAIIPWSYISEAMTTSGQSLVDGRALLGKVYFPRLIFPIAPILSQLVDFGISILIILSLFVYYGITLTWNIMLFPFFIIIMACIPAAVGMWLSSLAIRFRDIKFAMPFIIRMLMYSAPIVYSASSIPEKYRVIYSLNPIVGAIEGIRSSLLGIPFQWQYIVPGLVTLVILMLTGILYFRRMERIIVDVI